MVEYRTVLIIISGVLAAMSSLPYLIGVLNHRTRPRIATWITWSIIKVIVCTAAFVDHQYVTGGLLLISLMGTLSVAIFGWEFGNRRISHVDAICLVGVVIGIILWAIFNSPAMGVLAVIVIDIIGGIPTIIHSWHSPRHEAWGTFFISLIAAVSILMTVVDWQITAFAFPLYLAFMNTILMSVILLRRWMVKK